MIRWLKAMLRHHAQEAFLAGIYDGWTAGDGSPPLTDEQAANALRAIMGVTNPDTAAATAVTAETRPPLGSPAVAGPPALAEAPRRGPGRPRKFQEPPLT